ncbi:MAG: hypothetical protein JRJ19_02910 [Deltaproteobacteria bacterium]|nr:hypothetical protein [Deltaproteobacteria bacterium]MBW1870983.1 hypothetical protein [Deltaproteobacteria bacterium]
MEQPTFIIKYVSVKKYQQDCRQQILMQGLLLKTDYELAQFTAVLIRIVAPDDEEFELSGEVVQFLPGQGLAVQFWAETSAIIKQLVEKCEQALPSDSAVDLGQDPIVSTPGQTEPDRVTRNKNLQQQIAEMSVAQKRQACLHSRKDMRMLLIRDRNKTIHPFVMRNPAITLDEIEQISKMPSVNPDVLRTIAKSREWNRSATVCRNLVRNPKTPMKEALQLLSKLPKSDIRALAKSGNVRTAIQQAARKKALG